MNKLEALAELEHEQWAHWTRYMLHEMLTDGFHMVENGMASQAIERWRRQIETPYAELSEDEKESDREWARKVMNLLDMAEGDHILTQEDWGFISGVYAQYPDERTIEQDEEIRNRIEARLGVEKMDEVHDWIAGIAQDKDA